MLHLVTTLAVALAAAGGDEYPPLLESAPLASLPPDFDDALVVHDRFIDNKRTGFVRLGGGMVFDLSALADRWRAASEAAPSAGPGLESATAAAMALVDAWHAGDVDECASRAAFPFAAWLAHPDPKHACNKKQH